MKPDPLKVLKIYNSQTDTLSLEAISTDLEQISKIKKCSFCGCNANTLKEFAAIAKEQGKDELAEKAESLSEDVTSKKRYECIGCNPCYPADISNLLFEMEGTKTPTDRLSDVCGSSSNCSTGNTGRWPVEKGGYFVGSEKSSVAVCTLASTELSKLVHTEMKENIAIAGYCETENIGIEKIIKNIITNPHIRYLVVCGNESALEVMGHLSGQAIVSLRENGISDKGRIIGAKGKRPILKNTTSEQVKQFQSQIKIINLIGSNSLDEIADAIHMCLSKKAGRFEANTISTSSKNLIVAQNPERLVLDKNGFFVIIPDKGDNKIYVEYYANSGHLLHTIVGTDAPTIYYTIIEKGFVSKLDHAAYLGKELTKAEYFLKHNIPYTQDKALGELEVETNLEPCC
jgi:tetrahydromethanopterin S-methyltransferase subunit A